jgi:SAM-dependent methyltransferase
VKVDGPAKQRRVPSDFSCGGQLPSSPGIEVHMNRCPGVKLVDPGRRSTIRETVVVQEVGSHQFHNPGDMLGVVDVCSGAGPVAREMVMSMTVKPQDVAYLAADNDPIAIATLRAQEENFRAFGKFELLQREAWDLKDLPPGNTDLIFLMYSIHHLPPRYFADTFVTLNSALNHEHGKMVILDMEEYPFPCRQLCASTFRSREVQRVLTSGGFNPQIVFHRKKRLVYQISVKHANAVDSKAMLAEISGLIQLKLDEAIRELNQIRAVRTKKIHKWNEANERIGTYASALADLQSYINAGAQIDRVTL